MLLLGLTGGIGMGKSTAASILDRLGVAVVDTDAIARHVVEPGQPALADIRARFGDRVLTGDGHLNRPVMAEVVFQHPDSRKDLEQILHPRIRDIWQRRVEEWRGSGIERGAVVIPLLFETKAEAAFDAVACVACSETTQRTRLRERGWTDTQIEGRLAAQIGIDEKIRRSRFVVWTEGPVAIQEDQWRLVLNQLG